MLPIISHINSNDLIPLAAINVHTTLLLPSSLLLFPQREIMFFMVTDSKMCNALRTSGLNCTSNTCVFQMVQTLASNGANSIWEHSLLDPAQVQSGRRKPNPQDKVQ